MPVFIKGKGFDKTKPYSICQSDKSKLQHHYNHTQYAQKKNLSHLCMMECLGIDNITISLLKNKEFTTSPELLEKAESDYEYIANKLMEVYSAKKHKCSLTEKYDNKHYESTFVFRINPQGSKLRIFTYPPKLWKTAAKVKIKFNPIKAGQNGIERIKEILNLVLPNGYQYMLETVL